MDRRLNPYRFEGPYTRVLGNLDIFSLLGLEESEIYEFLRIVVGHSALGRIVLGKLHEERLMSVVEYAKIFEPDEGLNLMRYIRLMTAAELEASMGRPLSGPQMSELFELYERYVRFIANPELSTEELRSHRELFSEEALKDSVIRRVLRLMGYHEFINHAEVLMRKGETELEILAGFDEQVFKRMQDVRLLVRNVERLMEEYWEKGSGFEDFARRLNESEFHGTGRLFQRLSPEVVLNVLWVILGASEECIINLNPVLKGLRGEEVIRRSKRIEKELGGELFRKLTWSGLVGLREELLRNRALFLPGTGLFLTLDPELNALTVGYEDVIREIKRCFHIMGRPLDDLSVGQVANQMVELDRTIQRLSAFAQSHRETPQRLWEPKLTIPGGYEKRFKKVVEILGEAK
ncbi:MAG: hypothetical protein ACK4WB_09665, partial [Desulfatiglandales bacterium]